MKLLFFLFFSFSLSVTLSAQKAGLAKPNEPDIVNTASASESHHSAEGDSSQQESKPSLRDENMTENSSSRPNHLGQTESMLSMVVLAFGLGIILLEIFLVLKLNIGAENAVKLIVISLIIMSTLFLMTIEYDNGQIAPAMGLFGTVAGYLLGRQQSDKAPKEEA